MNSSSDYFLARHTAVVRCFLAALSACLLLQNGIVLAQPAPATLEPWVQVEMTLFTYENANLDAEVWSPDK